MVSERADSKASFVLDAENRTQHSFSLVFWVHHSFLSGCGPFRSSHPTLPCVLLSAGVQSRTLLALEPKHVSFQLLTVLHVCLILVHNCSCCLLHLCLCPVVRNTLQTGQDFGFYSQKKKHLVTSPFSILLVLGLRAM